MALRCSSIAGSNGEWKNCKRGFRSAPFIHVRWPQLGIGQGWNGYGTFSPRTSLVRLVVDNFQLAWLEVFVTPCVDAFLQISARPHFGGRQVSRGRAVAQTPPHFRNSLPVERSPCPEEVLHVLQPWDAHTLPAGGHCRKAGSSFQVLCDSFPNSFGFLVVFFFPTQNLRICLLVVFVTLSSSRNVFYSNMTIPIGQI